MLDRRTCLQWLATAAVAPSAWAQTTPARVRNVWPQQAVQMIVPFPAGGPSAILAKHLAKTFERLTHQPMRLNHQSGGGGLAAAGLVAKSAADGHTLFMGGSHLTTARALFPVEEFDFIHDLRPLALVARIPQVVLVNPSRMRSRTMMEWLSDLSRKPARFRMATAGIGSSSHIYAELLKQHERLEMEFVHFRGSGPALQDLLTGTTDMMIDGLISALPHIRSGRLKALMVTGKARSAVLPDVPCAQELGVDIINNDTWYGVFAPKKLPDQTASAVVHLFEQMGQDEALQAIFANLGIRWGDLYGDTFANMIKQETLQWAQTLKAMGMSKILGRPVEEG